MRAQIDLIPSEVQRTFLSQRRRASIAVFYFVPDGAYISADIIGSFSNPKVRILTSLLKTKD